MTTINIKENAVNELFNVVADKVANLVKQSAEQMEKDWESNLKQCEDPSTYKFPFSIKVELKKEEKKANVKLEWALHAKRSFDLEITDDGTGDLPFGDEKEEKE